MSDVITLGPVGREYGVSEYDELRINPVNTGGFVLRFYAADGTMFRREYISDHLELNDRLACLFEVRNA